MSSAQVLMSGGPLEGSYQTIPSPFPAVLKYPMPKDEQATFWDVDQLPLLEDSYEVAVYRKGPMYPPTAPMRSYTGVYYFSYYEGTKY